MTTLFLSPKFTDDSQLLWRWAIKLGWDPLRLSWMLMDYLNPTEVKEKVIYGEMLFVELAAQALRVEIIEPPVDYLFTLPPEFVKREINICNSRKRLPTGTGPLFVKPLAGKGLIKAQVYQEPSELKLEEDVIVSDVVKFDIEFRCFCSEGKLRTLSPYLRHGELTEKADTSEWLEAEAFANKIAGESRLPIVVDIGRIEGRGWAAVEANGASSSGLVGCDPLEALGVIRKATKNG